MPRSPKMTGISVNEGKKTFKRAFRKPRCFNALKQLLTTIDLNDGFIEVDLRTSKPITEMLGQSSVSLKRPGILILKSADGEVCDIRGIQFSLFGALTAHIRRKKRTLRKLFVKLVCVQPQYRSGIQFLVDRLSEKYFKDQINKKNTDYLERMLKNGRVVSLKRLSFRKAFEVKNGHRYFSQRQFASKPGIYFIKKNDELYIGKSFSCVYRRCAVHFREKAPWLNGHSGKHVYLDPVNGEYQVCLVDFPRDPRRSIEIMSRISTLERWLIATLHPSMNKMFVEEEAVQEVEAVILQDIALVDDNAQKTEYPF